MKIVIDIPEEKLSIIKNKMYCGIYDADIYKAIENGTPLPKGHGRLIDADELAVDHTSFDWNDYVSAEQIKNAKTIVEADKEGAEG